MRWWLILATVMDWFWLLLPTAAAIALANQ